MVKHYFILSIQTKKETKPKHSVVCVNSVLQIYSHFFKLLSSRKLKTFGLTRISKKDFEYYTKKLENKIE